MTRFLLVLAVLIYIVGCENRPQAIDVPVSVVSVAITGDDGVEFEGHYEWNDGKTNNLSGVVRVREDGSVSPRTFHNAIPDNRYITSLKVQSLSESGVLGVTIKRIKREAEKIVFQGEASGTRAKIVYHVP